MPSAAHAGGHHVARRLPAGLVRLRSGAAFTAGSVRWPTSASTPAPPPHRACGQSVPVSVREVHRARWRGMRINSDLRIRPIVRPKLSLQGNPLLPGSQNAAYRPHARRRTVFQWPPAARCTAPPPLRTALAVGKPTLRCAGQSGAEIRVKVALAPGGAAVVSASVDGSPRQPQSGASPQTRDGYHPARAPGHAWAVRTVETRRWPPGRNSTAWPRP